MKTTRQTLLTAMTAGLVIRLAIVPFVYTEWTDPFVVEHWAFGRIARSLAQGRGFGSPFADTGSSALLPPVYAWCLALIFRIFGSNTVASVVAAAGWNGILSVVTCIPVFFIAKRCFGQRAAQWAAWGWALSPYGIYYSADWLWSTCLFTLLLTTLFLYSLHLEERDSRGVWIGFGFVTGVAALTEPVALAVVPLWAMFSAYRLFRRGKRWLAPLVFAGLAAALTMAPWILRNYEIFHELIPVRGGFGLELYLGNNGYSARWVNSALHPNHSDAELAEYETAGEIAYMAHKRDQAVAFIESHPRWFAGMTLRRMVYLWTGYWSFDPAYLAEEPLDPPNIFMAMSLLLLMLAGLRRAFRESSAQAPRFAATFLLYPLAYYITHPETYYLRPLDPLVAILALYALMNFFSAPKAVGA